MEWIGKYRQMHRTADLSPLSNCLYNQATVVEVPYHSLSEHESSTLLEKMVEKIGSSLVPGTEGGHGGKEAE